MPEMYGKTIARDHAGALTVPRLYFLTDSVAKPPLTLPPHPFGAAELIAQLMRQQGKNQTIVFRYT